MKTLSRSVQPLVPHCCTMGSPYKSRWLTVYPPQSTLRGGTAQHRLKSVLGHIPPSMTQGTESTSLGPS